MANVYYGDGYTNAGDGNWNTVGNWYLTLGSAGICCPLPGTPYGKVPQPGDSVILAGIFFASSFPVINTGPIGGWAGPISWATSNSGLIGSSLVHINDGVYSGTVNIGPASGYSPSFPNSSVTLQHAGISGGTFTGTVNLNHGIEATGGTVYWQPEISGGIFTGIVNRVNPQGTSNSAPYLDTNRISGGTYSPTANVTLTAGNQVNPAGIPTDPGFKVGGGTFSPVLNITGNVYPAVGDVRSGVHYGPTGADFTGSLVAKSPAWGQVYL